MTKGSINKPLGNFSFHDSTDFSQGLKDPFATDKNENNKVRDANFNEPPSPKPAYNLSVGHLPAWAKKQVSQL